MSPAPARVAAGLAVVTALASACGTAPKAASPPPTPLPTAPPTIAPVVYTARFCNLVDELYAVARERKLVGPGGVLAGAPADVGAVVVAMGPTLDELATAAPPATREDAEAVVAGLRAGAEGDAAALGAAAYRSAGEALDVANHDICTVDSRPAPGGS